MEPMTNSEQIRSEISRLQDTLQKLEAEEAKAELLAKKRDFVKSKLNLLHNLVGHMKAEDIASQCHMMNIGDMLEDISECLGYQLRVPMELRSLTVAQIFCALNLIKNDERFRA